MPDTLKLLGKDMLKFSLYTVVLKNVMRKPFRYGLMFFSIIIMTALISAVSIIDHAVDSHLSRIRGRFGADIIIAPEGNARQAEEVLLEPKTHEFYLNKSIIGQISKMPFAEKVTAHIYLSTIASDCCGLPFDTKVVLFDQDTDFIVAPWLIKSINRKLNANETIVGVKAEEYYSLLDFSSNVLFNRPFVIAGVLDEIGSGLDYALFIEDDALPNILESANVGVGIDEVSLIFVIVDSETSIEAAAEEIRREVNNVDVITRSDVGQTLTGMLGDLLNLAKVSILFIGFIGISLNWATYSAIINERVREFAILRLLGAKKTNVLRLVIIEALLLGAAASISGVSAGTVVILFAPFEIGLIAESIRMINPSAVTYAAINGLSVGMMVPVISTLSLMWHVFRMEANVEIKK